MATAPYKQLKMCLKTCYLSNKEQFTNHPTPKVVTDINSIQQQVSYSLNKASI